MDTFPDTCKHQYFLFTYLHKSGGTNLTLLEEDKNPSVYILAYKQQSFMDLDKLYNYVN